MKTYTHHLFVLILFLVFTIRCSENPEIKRFLNRNELSNLVLSRSDFKPFISTHLQNFIALNSMGAEDDAKLIHFYNDFKNGLREIPLEINNITQNLNIDISTFGYINSLKKELNKNYPL